MKNTEPKITWINHASFLIEYGDVKLISDPWLEGRVFNNSWDLLAKSKFEYADFEKITHIWFSHEHPDHFFPPNINKIPEPIRRDITVLFQETEDKKVVDFCRKIGFKEVIELKPFQKFELEETFFVTNASVSNDTDSWLLLELGDKVVLNLNDCIIRDESELKKIKNLYSRLDLLLTQFSYANWVGNPEDSESKELSARKKQEEILRYAKTFQPEFIIPFASYVWFCSEYNFHMNNEANKIQDVSRLIAQSNFTPIVLYPGEEWVIGEKHNNENALTLYEQDRVDISKRNQTKFDLIAAEELEKSAQNYTKRIRSKNNVTRINRYEPMNVFIRDYGVVYSFCFKNGLRINKNIPKEEADIIMCSQNLKYCFDFEWGYDSIQVAGTFEKTTKGNFARYQEYQWISTLNNKGGRINGYIKALLHKFFK